MTAARTTYGLPYFHADKHIDEARAVIRYHSSRVALGPQVAGHDIEIEPGCARRPSTRLAVANGAGTRPDQTNVARCAANRSSELLKPACASGER